MHMNRPALAALVLTSAALLSAHVGSPDTYYVGKAGPYGVQVVIRAPQVIPARAEVNVRVTGGGVTKVTAAPYIWNGGEKGAPGNEGMSSLTVRATSLAPDAGLAAQVNAPVPSRVANPYQLSVQAGTNAATAIAYGVQAAIWLKNDRELFYSRIVETAPLVEASPATVRNSDDR